MVLYTPLVESDIFPSTESTERKLISYEGRSLRVTSLESGEYEVEQLLSTNPQDFLNESFSPGAIIKH